MAIRTSAPLRVVEVSGETGRALDEHLADSIAITSVGDRKDLGLLPEKEHNNYSPPSRLRAALPVDVPSSRFVMHCILISMAESRANDIEKEVAKLREATAYEKPKRIELTDDGELEEIVDEYEQPKRLVQ